MIKVQKHQIRCQKAK